MAGFLQVTEVVRGQADFSPQAAGLQEPASCTTPTSETHTSEGRELGENAETGLIVRSSLVGMTPVRAEMVSAVCCHCDCLPLTQLHSKHNLLYFGPWHVQCGI